MALMEPAYEAAGQAPERGPAVTPGADAAGAAARLGGRGLSLMAPAHDARARHHAQRAAVTPTADAA